MHSLPVSWPWRVYYYKLMRVSNLPDAKTNRNLFRDGWATDRTNDRPESNANKSTTGTNILLRKFLCSNICTTYTLLHNPHGNQSAQVVDSSYRYPVARTSSDSNTIFANECNELLIYTMPSKQEPLSRWLNRPTDRPSDLLNLRIAKSDLPKNSCEIENFVERHVCKLRAMLWSRVLRALYDLMKDIYIAKCGCDMSLQLNYGECGGFVFPREGT